MWASRVERDRSRPIFSGSPHPTRATQNKSPHPPPKTAHRRLRRRAQPRQDRPPGRRAAIGVSRPALLVRDRDRREQGRRRDSQAVCRSAGDVFVHRLLRHSGAHGDPAAAAGQHRRRSRHLGPGDRRPRRCVLDRAPQCRCQRHRRRYRLDVRRRERCASGGLPTS